ncbi:hypothetical protein B5P43_15765 [Bacillus sp. SRB_336]|nr:hypothetical protein B5P43_15765 [Bacillus sp. SRB_336]
MDHAFAPAASTSPLATFDGSLELAVLIERYSLRKAEECHVLGRHLTLAVTNADGTRVRVLRGVIRRQVTGGKFSITDTDGFIVGRSVARSQIVAWTADPVSSRLQAAAAKALCKISEENRRAFESSMAELTNSQLAMAA